MMRGLSRASPSAGHFPIGFRRVAFGADRPCCDRLDAGLARQPSSRTHVAPRTMLPRGAGSPKSSFSEIRTLAAGAAGAETERRVRKTAVLYEGGTTSSNPSSSSGESRANLRRVPSRLGIFAFGPSRGRVNGELALWLPIPREGPRVHRPLYCEPDFFAAAAVFSAAWQSRILPCRRPGQLVLESLHRRSEF